MNMPEGMNMLAAAAALVAPGKGILAADESIPTMSARLQRAGVPPAAGSRRAYREMLVTTPGLCRGISGVILCAETLSQRVSGGRSFPAAIRELGMLPGIKADAGTRPLAGTAGETVTEGLDGLADRLRLHAGAGARFAKWRAVFRIGAGSPSAIAVRANAQALARYAAACQEAGLVPVVEPEVLMEGDHSLSQCEAVTSLVLLQVSSELQDYGVDFGAVVLKPNMVLPGSDSPERATPGQAAAATAAALGALPAALAGVAFLSGGQRPERATENLAALQQIPRLWPFTFSFGRALVDPALAAWRGEQDRVAAGQRALTRRVAMNVAALECRYTPEHELAPELA
jgi:fructose-bisphosphate aldolase class I